MKQLRYFALALLFGAMISIQAFADGKPNPGGGNGLPIPGGPNHFGLSDSCWNVFLAGLSSGDAAKLTADQTTITTDETQVDTLQKQMMNLLKGGRATRDSATLAQIKALDGQIRTLNNAINTAQMDIGSIIKNNGTLLETVSENCGRPKRDTGRGGNGGGDTTKGGRTGGGDHGVNTKGHFGLSDSCWNIFISEISKSSAALLVSDQQTITSDEAQIDTILKQIRSFKGNLKDSATRAKVKALLDEIRGIEKSMDSSQRNYASIIKQNDSLLQSIRQNCGRTTHHKGTVGDPGNGLSATDIVPNPATANGTASMTVTVTNDAEVMIFISSAVAQGPPAKMIFNGTLTAGSHMETLNLAGLGTGAYIVTIESGGTTIMKKLMIQ
jgi:hypothetical protein